MSIVSYQSYMSKELQSKGETNFFALVLIMLFTAFVLITAFGDDQSFSSADTSPAVASNNTQTDTETISTTTHYLMPTTIPVDDTATIENRMVTGADGKESEQTITFKSQLAAPAIAREYQDWMAENGYTITDERIGTKAASLKAANGNRGLVVFISHYTSSGLSHVEIHNFDNSRL